MSDSTPDKSLMVVFCSLGKTHIVSINYPYLIPTVNANKIKLGPPKMLIFDDSNCPKFSSFTYLPLINSYNFIWN